MKDLIQFFVVSLCLIICDAGQKGWFMRELRKRDDVKLIEMKPFLDAIQ